MTAYPCFVCETATTRGSLLRIDGEWLAVPLCKIHVRYVADRLPDAHVIDATRRN